ncbi:hypothetical protein SOVF_151610 [Spinacia oleracea]|uniref:S-adenosyl-L-methionine-dependent methyltransferase n=1 Tax=Spinacia oleracea TaxID=3562 RepID=A0ABM3RDJ8_SPIOL|nr:uncharacterized protein LOC110785115 [Spinacia oleracea]KNA09651.1 hypothetical protein SOVF_151610 [Spinacia oleracea]
MKDDQDHHHQQHHHPFHHRRFWKLSGNYLRNPKPAAYLILLILTYALGYFTASPSLSSNQITTTAATSSSTPTVSTTLTTCNCPPAASPPILDKNNDHNRFGPECANPIPPELTRSTILNRVFNGTSPYDNFPPPHLANLLLPKRVKGWGSNGAVFENLINKVRPKVIIEVGTFLGASATHMAGLTRQLGLDTQILCLDDFRGWLGFRDRTEYVPIQNGDVLLMAQFLQNVVYYNATESILPIPFSTGSTLQKLCEMGVMADLIEVDAGHDFHSAWSDINWAHKLLRPGGVMFGHDYHTKYDNRGVRRAVDLFAKVHGFKVKVDGQHWVIE